MKKRGRLWTPFYPFRFALAGVREHTGKRDVSPAGVRKTRCGAKYTLPELTNSDPPGCLCSRVVQGKSLPEECTLFGKRCTPENPVGPCMVSSEGSCAAHFKYGAL